MNCSCWESGKREKRRGIEGEKEKEMGSWAAAGPFIQEAGFLILLIRVPKNGPPGEGAGIGERLNEGD